MNKLTCHCNKVEIEVKIPEPLTKALRCNCTLCKRKSAVMTMVAPEDFKIVKGQDFLKLYQYHTKVAKHYFCSNCGIYTHHNPRSNPLMYGINLACVEEINTLELKNVSINDGAHHPLDKK